MFDASFNQWTTTISSGRSYANCHMTVQGFDLTEKKRPPTISLSPSLLKAIDYTTPRPTPSSQSAQLHSCVLSRIKFDISSRTWFSAVPSVYHTNHICGCSQSTVIKRLKKKNTLENFHNTKSKWFCQTFRLFKNKFFQGGNAPCNKMTALQLVLL